jgi:hypothetical protein
MSIIKGIKVGSTDVISSYTSLAELLDTENLRVVAAQLGSISLSSDSTYTGSAQTPLPTVTAFVGEETVTLRKDIDYTLSYSNNTNAGVATVTATGINNYQGSISTSWNINNADLEVTATDQSYTYDGTYKGSGINVSFIGDNSANVVIEYGIGSATYTTTELPKIKNVLDSTTIYFKVTVPNHNVYEGSYRLEIKPKTATLSWGANTWVYDGAAHSTTCTVSNLI